MESDCALSKKRIGVDYRLAPIPAAGKSGAGATGSSLRQRLKLQVYNLENTGVNGLHLGEYVADFDKLLVQLVEHKNQATSNEYY